MYILSVDTTAKTACCAVCIWKDDGGLFPVCSSQLNSTLTHSESILPMIDFCLKNANVSINDIDVIGVSAGPGSFTGVRIGIATVKGLAFGSEKIKCVSVSALEALSYNVDLLPEGYIICACMDARRQQFYNAIFESDGNKKPRRLIEDRAIDVNELFDQLKEKYTEKRIVLVGDGAELAFKLFSQMDGFDNMQIAFCGYDYTFQNGVSVAKCALFHADEAVSAKELSPVYLRMSQAERERNEKQELKQ